MNPFASNIEQRIDGIGENQLLKNILSWLGAAVPAAPFGPGDDCALIPKLSTHRMITTDPIWYQRHFDASLAPESVGRKIVVRNLSDLAAAGATPEGALFSLFSPTQLSIEWLERCCRSIGKTCVQYGLKICGGDIAQIPSDLGLSLTAWGTTHSPVPGRGKASPGDTLWVTGQLGGSILQAHWQFEPRLAEGAWLTSTGAVSAMMDISDGLAADLPRLLGKDRGARLDLDLLPIREDAIMLSQVSHKPDWWHAWSDGEDYELLFALKKDQSIQTFQEQWQKAFKTKLTCIGEVTSIAEGEDSLQFSGVRTPPPSGGYEHFRKSDS
jgi:thiamine-monophosphate kinase